MKTSIIRATGSYLPQKRLTNADLATMVDTNDEWIRERTGITVRHIAADDQSTSHLALEAAKAALANAGLSAADIDGIVVGTSTPDSTMPSVATKVQAGLGVPRGAAVDVAAACTGFVAALATAHGWIMTGVASRVIVIGAECMSRIIDWQDRTTCILFGDGAGAVILEAHDGADGRGIKAISLEAAGEFGPLLGTDGGTASTKTAGHLFMQGQEVFRHGVEKMVAITHSTLAKAGLSIADVDLVVAHQANARMITKIGRTLKLPEEKCMVTVDRHANTSAASIPLALDVAAREGKLRPGAIVAMPALGAGLTWGCCVTSW
ncbi:MAG: 3-oxoacyl-ACP synthase [Azospirillum brasilense]|nr:MAG: 3-oxoacyl-ACP synthase [Azospirillum brasilense]